MAYVLGFFAADGCMIKNNRGAHFIEFQITDKDILLKMRKLLGSNHKITERNRNEKWKTAYRLQIGSKEIFNDLIKLGFTPNKTKVVRFPKVPKKFICHFVRGYFDGDGNVFSKTYKRADRGGRLSITILSGFTCGSKIFLDKLFENLRLLADIKGGTLFARDGAFRLYFSVNDSFKLYNFMYNNCEKLFLSRKKEVFEKYFKLDR